jgi:catechol 2,3-dioxygenase-like lactoylglutathione lyase family enzyme
MTVAVESKRLHHVNLLVDDLDAADRFYGDVLGWPTAPRPDFGFPGAWYDLGHGQLHLVVVDEMPPPSGAHFAVEVADLETVMRDLKDAGIEVSAGGGTPGAGRQAFCQDPAGNLIEFNQPD